MGRTDWSRFEERTRGSSVGSRAFYHRLGGLFRVSVLARKSFRKRFRELVQLDEAVL